MFTKRHYEAIAKVVAVTHREGKTLRKQYAEGLTDDLIVLFYADNPNFRAQQFRVACGLEADT